MTTALLAGVVTLLAAVRSDVPVEPSREEARGWALRELAGREYAQARPGLVQRMANWLFERLASVDVAANPVSAVALAVVIVIVTGVIIWAINRAGGLRRTAHRTGGAVFSTSETTAAEHRAAADRHAAGGAWGLAVVERFRAVARELEERAVLTPQLGRTADEVARDAGRWLPMLAGSLARGARLFDDVLYGDRTVGAVADGELRQLDAAVQRARPAAQAAPAEGLVLPS